MTLREFCRPRWVLGSLLIAGAAMFAIGIAAERHANAHHTEHDIEAVNPAPTTVQTTLSGEADGDEATHTDETTSEGTTHMEAPGGETPGQAESSAETVLGLSLESNALVVVAVVVFLALAALTWFRNRRGLLFATVAFVLVFTVFDIAEVIHQIKESRSALATLAAAIALVHIATALVAEQRATTAPS